MRKQKKSIVTGALFIAITLILFLPGVSFAGSLEPSDPPGPTMKTLDEVLPAWSQKLRADDGDPDGCNSSRFKCVLDNQAVLDKETGLVWEKSPYNYLGDWWEAQWQCRAAGPVNHGGRRGWRLPTFDEFESLYEICPGNDIRLPCGHPFINVNVSSFYWTATNWIFDSNQAYARSPRIGPGPFEKTWTYGYNWCVRGGFGVNYEGY